MAKPAVATLQWSLDEHFPIRTFQPGDVVSGRFKILKFLGEGGMGEVYSAEDPELGINVALKTIRAEIAADPKTLARFKQELSLSRRITHCNVCRAFDLYYHMPAGGGRYITYLTMELLEGETLADRLRRGRMTATEAVPLVLQMVDALDSAHSVGVIHRDFKPSNIILCNRIDARESGPDIRAVITDFGLAHNISSVGASASLTHSGQLVGTLAYMSPEQAEGKVLTPATDIYSLGLVMYEMVTGERPFKSDSPFGGVIQRLSEGPPFPSNVQPDLSAQWDNAILGCLQRTPEQRFQRVTQVREALQDSAPHRALWKVPKRWTHGPPSGRTGKLLYTSVTVAAFLIFVAILGQRNKWFSWAQAKPNPPMLAMTQFTLDGGVTLDPSLSYDGRTVAYSSDRAGTGTLDIWLQPTAGGPARQVTHELSDATEPSLSGDSSMVAFRSEGDGGIYVLSTVGGSKEKRAEAGRDPKFSPDGKTILYWTGNLAGETSNPSFSPGAKIYMVSASGDTTRPIAEDFVDARYPVWFPDGKHILFQGAPSVAGSVLASSDWWIADLSKPGAAPVKTGAFEILRNQSIIPEEFPPQWWEQSIIFSARMAQSINLFKIRIDPNTFNIAGEPERLTFGTGYESGPAVSTNGRLFFASVSAPIRIWAMNLRAGGHPGKLMQLTTASSWDTRPSISSDGKKLVFARRLGNVRDVWFKDLVAGAESSLTRSAVTDPVISRDGAQVAYSVYPDSHHAKIESISIATGVKRTVCEDCGEPLDWTSDGEGILYSFRQLKAIGYVNVKSGEQRVLLSGPKALSSASFCPQERCMAVTEALDGARSKLWLVPLHDLVAAPPAQWTELTDGRFTDDKPRLSVEGKTLYFYSNRDGFYCLWSLRLPTATMTLPAKPLPFLHLHNASFSLRELPQSAFDLRVASDKLVFNVVSTSANLWMTDLQRP